MSPIEAQAALARMIHARATTDDVAYALAVYVADSVTGTLPGEAS